MDNKDQCKKDQAKKLREAAPFLQAFEHSLQGFAETLQEIAADVARDRKAKGRRNPYRDWR